MDFCDSQIDRQDPSDLSPEFQDLADLVSQQPPHVRELFRNALVLAMLDDEKARVTGTRIEAGREYLKIVTSAGDGFEILRPEITEEVEAELMKQVRSIVDEDATATGE